MRGVMRGHGSLEVVKESAARLGLIHHVSRLTCTRCQRCATCEQFIYELFRDVVFWKGQAKTAIKRRDELDQTILAIDGGVGHWRRVSKRLSSLLNMSRNEINCLKDPTQYRRASEKQIDEQALHLSEVLAAAAEREEEVERRITRARDLLYELRKTAGVDTPMGQEIHKAWSTL